jgi:bifunctional NMN adenylyltransferase/nudix hydrolase
MEMKKYNNIVLIGRFQPFHNAHLDIVTEAMKLADQLIIVVGSANKPRSFKNPFTVKERISIISDALYQQKLEERYHCQVWFTTVEDTFYNDNAWATRVQEGVSKFVKPDQTTAIIGHKKDETSFYLDMFPQWPFEDFPVYYPLLHASDIRDLYFRKNVNFDYLSNVISPTTLNFLIAFYGTSYFDSIVEEREFIEEYKQQFAGLKYAPVFVTADAVVTCAGHILLVERGAKPGKGLWALPGGFLNANTDRSMRDCMIRELREETKLKVPAPVLLGSIVNERVFDAIHRSDRGRIITHAFHIALPVGPLPKVKGSDDARHAEWVPIGSLKAEEFFDDHIEIIRYFTGT